MPARSLDLSLLDDLLGIFKKENDVNNETKWQSMSQTKRILHWPIPHGGTKQRVQSSSSLPNYRRVIVWAYKKTSKSSVKMSI